MQALVHAVSHASDLGNEIAALLPHMPRYVADVTATNNEGKFDQESDKTWLISTKTVDLLLKGSWAEINWHDDVMLSLMRWRGERDLPQPLGNGAGAREKQWICPERHLLAEYVERMLSALGLGYDGARMASPR